MSLVILLALAPLAVPSAPPPTAPTTIFFDDFSGPAVPQDLETYREYRRRTQEFIHARNARIQRYAASLA